MSGRILIIDDIATNRIVLKVKLAAASYEVLQAGDLSSGRMAVLAQAPRLVILSDRLGGADGTAAFCGELSAHPASAGIPVIVTTHDASRATRMALLAAGAAEVMTHPVDEAALLARVRSLLRRRAQDGALGRAAAPLPELALAEAPARFDHPAVVALVSSDPVELRSWRSSLATHLRDRFLTMSPAELLERLRVGPVLDAVVLSAPRPRLGDLRLIAELRARPETEGAAIVVVPAESDPEFGIMALDLGANDVLPAGFDAEELALRLRTRLREKREAETRRRRVEEGLRLAVTDALTGLMNRRAAFAGLRRMAAEAKAGGRSYALMILDIDRFKDVNDRHGHAAGDRVLVEVARRLAQNLREGDLLARIGGEEFMVAIPDTALVPARVAAERLRRAIEAEPVRLAGGATVYVTLSIGLCLIAPTDETVDAAFERADRALYVAKDRGRNIVTVGRSVA